MPDIQQSLTEQLGRQRDELAKHIPPEVQSIMQDGFAELAGAGVGNLSLSVGDPAPEFTLTNKLGLPVHLSRFLEKGPVVLSFYRGGWCPFCNLELRALQAAMPELRAVGASLIAISPEIPDESLKTSGLHELSFPVLSDEGNAVARKFGLVFTLPAALRPIYEQFGIDLPRQNGDDSFTLPVPATYVIGADAVIRYAFVNIDYTQRAEPAEIIAVCKEATAGR